MRDAEYFITPRADLGSSCVEAKILRHINDAFTTAMCTVHNIKGPHGITALTVCEKAAGTFLWRLAMNMIHDWMIHWGQWQSQCVGRDLVLSLPFPLPLLISHSPLFMEHCSVYGGSVLDCSPRGTFLHLKNLHKGSMKRQRDMAVSPSPISGNWLQILTCTTYIQMWTQSVRCRLTPSVLFSSPTRKLCSRETNCCVVLALQWRMKVHRARQTSTPLQPPLSNKHIY